MIKHKHTQTFIQTGALAAIGAATLALSPAGASAQNQTGERIYVDLGRWTIVEQASPRNCTLRHAGPNGLRLVMSKFGTNDAQLSLQLANRNVFVGGVTFAFDEDEFPARSSGSRVYTPDADASQIEIAFRQARVMTLRQGGATLATVSLDGSSAGFRLLKQCSEQGRLGLARAPAPPPEPEQAPPPVRSQPAPAQPAAQAQTQPLSPPPSMARPAMPRDPQSWVRRTTFAASTLPNMRGQCATRCSLIAGAGPRNVSSTPIQDRES